MGRSGRGGRRGGNSGRRRSEPGTGAARPEGPRTGTPHTDGPDAGPPRTGTPRTGAAHTDGPGGASGANGAAPGSKPPRDGKPDEPRGRAARGNARGPRRPRQRWLRQVDEFSAGGLVVDLDGEVPRGALIARTDRHGRLLWSLPKGHIEAGETAEQAAVREVEEETGISGVILAELGTIDFWFVAEGRRIHKTVQHYLLRAVGGELSDADIEVTEVAWVPLPEIAAQLAYPDERGLVHTAGRLLAESA